MARQLVQKRGSPVPLGLRRPQPPGQQSQAVKRWSSIAIPAPSLRVPSPPAPVPDNSASKASLPVARRPADQRPQVVPANRLLHQLRRSSNWRSLRETFQQHREQLSSADFSQLMNKLQAVARPQFMSRIEAEQLHTFLDDLSTYAKDASASLRAQEWATLLVMLGNLGSAQQYSVDPSVLHTALLTLHQQVDSMTAMELARTISNAVSLGASPPVSDLQPLIAALGKHLSPDLRGAHFGAEHIEPVITALKRVNINPGSDWLHKFGQTLQQNLSSVPTQSIISILAAFVYFDYRPQEQLVAKLVTRIGSSFYDLRPSHIPVLLEALVLFEHKPSEMFLRQLISKALVSSSYFSPQEVLRLLQSLERLGQKLDADWIDVFMLQVRPGVRQLAAHELLLLMKVLAAQSYKPRPGLLSSLLDHTYDAMRSYSPAQLASLANSLGRCSCKPSVQWVSQLMGRIRTIGLQAMTDEELLTLLAGMPGMQYTPSQEWLAAAVHRLDPGLAANRGLPAPATSSNSSSTSMLSAEQRCQLQALVQQLQYKPGVSAAAAATAAAAETELEPATMAAV